MTDEKNRNRRRVVEGLVTSTKMDKTIVVELVRTIMHPQFKKYIRRRSRFHAHDENNEASLGDRVAIMETRPISKMKSFRLLKILAKARIPASTPTVESIDPEGSGE
jgi:small subunit ribosomal protein S17